MESQMGTRLGHPFLLGLAFRINAWDILSASPFSSLPHLLQTGFLDEPARNQEPTEATTETTHPAIAKLNPRPPQSIQPPMAPLCFYRQHS
ncbi:hypothetical protein Mal65_21900 [Crateriforma conspicua]|nr:hypothetical protein Mal65_21900 [Crateriforma conspicua]